MIGSYLDYLEEIMFFSAQFFRGVLLFSFSGVVIVIAIGKTENLYREKSKDKLIQTRLGSLKKTTRGLTTKVRVTIATITFFLCV